MRADVLEREGWRLSRKGVAFWRAKRQALREQEKLFFLLG